MRPLTKAKFAAERGVSRTRVYQWIDDGRVQVIAEGPNKGKIDADVAHQVLGALLDQTKGVRRQGNITSETPPTSSTQPDLVGGVSNSKPDDDSAGSERASVPGGRESGEYWSHKTESEKYEVLQKKIRVLQTARALTSADGVRKERRETARSVRNALTAMVDRVAPVLDPGNPARAHKLLLGEVQKILLGLRHDLDERAAGTGAVSSEPTAALQ